MSPSQLNKGPSNASVIGFIICLSFACALVLSLLASMLRQPQAVAKELDRSEQMLIAARIFHPAGYFQIRNEDGEYVPAKHLKNGILVAASTKDAASSHDILKVYRNRIRAFLVNSQGSRTTFQEAKTTEEEYTNQYKKEGYANLSLKLVYEILHNPATDSQRTSQEPEGYVIPINGYGLWDAIYGYLAIATDGTTVIGISWYDHKETPGLGAVISEEGWQRQFQGKQIVPPGTTDWERASIGITVVRGKVADVIGTGPKEQTSVDGIPGATLTGNGVSKAYYDTLRQYRQFLITLQKGQ